MYFNGLIERQSRHALLNYSTPAKLLNLVRLMIQRKRRRSNPSAYPYRLIVDVTNSCNLRCLHCPTGKQVKGRPKGFMDLESYGRILDQLGDYIYIIDLFNWGESFLNRNIVQMIAMAEQKKVCTSIHTNLNIPLSDEKLDDLLHSELSYLTVSLDGADQETYALYRRGGSLATALDNARRILRLRREKGRRKPHLTWQYLIFPHNGHQVDEARKLSDEIGFDRFVAINGITSRNRQDRADSGDTEVMKNLRGGMCDWLWTTATLHWDNRIGPCCLQFMARDDFGSFGDDGFMAVWNNRKFQYARSLFSRQPRDWQDIICNHCYKVRGDHQTRAAKHLENIREARDP